MAAVARVARIELEALLRTRKLDNTLTAALPAPGPPDEQAVVPTGIAALDERLRGGVPRGQVSEVTGPRSSGRTSLLFSMLAGATARGEIAALVDTLDMFDAVSAAACGIELGRLLWIRGQWPVVSGQWSGNWHGGGRGGNVAGRAMNGDCRQGIETCGASLRSAVGDGGTRPSCTPTASVDGQSASRVVHQGDARRRHPALAAGTTQAGAWERAIDRAVKALNLVLQAGGFGLVALDLAEVPSAVVRRLPFTTWLRLQRVIEGSSTACLLLGAAPIARSAGGVTIALARAAEGSSSRFPVHSSRDVTRDPLKTGNREPRTDKHRTRLFPGLDIEARISRARWPDTTPCRFEISDSSLFSVHGSRFGSSQLPVPGSRAGNLRTENCEPRTVNREP